jgi:hypothetical protein
MAETLWAASPLPADGQMMSVVCDGRRELPVGASREYSSYCGIYTYVGRGLSPGLTRPQIRAVSAAIRCAACALMIVGSGQFKYRVSAGARA